MGLRLIQSEVPRCKGITDSLLDFSRPKATDKSLVDVNAAIERTLFVLKHHTRFKKLTVETDLDRSLGPVVLANEEQLVQVFMALLLNAHGRDARAGHDRAAHAMGRRRAARRRRSGRSR